MRGHSLLDILGCIHLFFSYPLASKGGITVHYPVHKLQYVIHKFAALCCHMLPQMFKVGLP